jgi:hypothetical protein
MNKMFKLCREGVYIKFLCTFAQIFQTGNSRYEENKEYLYVCYHGFIERPC